MKGDVCRCGELTARECPSCESPVCKTCDVCPCRSVEPRHAPCPHGRQAHDCDDCDRESDHAFDAAREQALCGRIIGRD